MTWFLSGLCSSLRCRPRARYRPAFGEPDLGKTGDRCSLYKDMYDLKSYIIHMYIYIYTGYWWVRTCGPGWVRTCWGLVLSLVSTVWSAYGELARIATWVRSFGTWDLPKLPTHVRWTRSETWMQVWKNTLINDRDFMFCGSSKGWWDRKLQWF